MTWTYNDIRLTYNTTISTYNGAEYFLPIGVFDNIQISENFGGYNPIFLFVLDNLSMVEEITASNEQLGGISASDYLNIHENITAYATLNDISLVDAINLSEDFEAILLSYIFASDTVNISEELSFTGQLGDINKNDGLRIREDIESVATLPDFSVDDSINISEDYLQELLSDVRGIDALEISEVTSNTGQLGDVDIDDLLGITGPVNAENPWLGPIITDSSVLVDENIHPELISHVYPIDVIITSELITMESFRFSPSDIRPIGKIRETRPTDGKLSGFF